MRTDGYLYNSGIVARDLLKTCSGKLNRAHPGLFFFFAAAVYLGVGVLYAVHSSLLLFKFANTFLRAQIQKSPIKFFLFHFTCDHQVVLLL